MDQCSTCKFYKPNEYYDLNSGDCRQRSPVLVTGETRVTDSGFNVDAYNRAFSQTSFPTVESDSWCGSFEKATEVDGLSSLRAETPQDAKVSVRLMEPVIFDDGRRPPSKPTGVELIAQERTRQVHVEKWDAGHDDSHRDGELAIEAALWATQTTAEESMCAGMCGIAQDRLRKSRVRQLAIAGALIAAEIDRLLRVESQGISENARLHNDNE